MERNPRGKQAIKLTAVAPSSRMTFASFTEPVSSHSSAASAAAEVGENMIPDVIGFEILSEYRIQVTLSNGKQGIFDVKPYLDKGIFTEFKEYRYFKRARIEYGTLVWPNEQDFSPETIEMRMIEPEGDESLFDQGGSYA